MPDMSELCPFYCDCQAAAERYLRMKEALEAVSKFYGWDTDGPLGAEASKVRAALKSVTPEK